MQDLEAILERAESTRPVPTERRRQWEPGNRVQRTPTLVITIYLVRSFEDIVRIGVGSVRVCSRILDPGREIRFYTPPLSAELTARLRDGTCRRQDGGDAVVSRERQLIVKKMYTTDCWDSAIQRIARVSQIPQ